jgi:hypothetical protein
MIADCTLINCAAAICTGENDATGIRKCWGSVACPTGRCPTGYEQGAFCYSNGNSEKYKVCCTSPSLAGAKPPPPLLRPPPPPAPPSAPPSPAPPPSPPLRGCSGNPGHCSSCGGGTCLKDFCPSGDVKARGLRISAINMHLESHADTLSTVPCLQHADIGSLTPR